MLTGIVQEGSDGLILARPEGPFALRLEWLDRVKPVDPRVRGVLLGADYVPAHSDRRSARQRHSEAAPRFGRHQAGAAAHQGLGIGDQGLGTRARDSGFGVRSSGIGARDSVGSGLGVRGSGFGWRIVVVASAFRRKEPKALDTGNRIRRTRICPDPNPSPAKLYPPRVCISRCASRLSVRTGMSVVSRSISRRSSAPRSARTDHTAATSALEIVALSRRRGAAAADRCRSPHTDTAARRRPRSGGCGRTMRRTARSSTR